MKETPEPERAAFEAIYTEHYWALLRFAARRLSDAESARDLVSDTFAVAWQRRSRIPAERPLPWLYRTAGNLLANQRRRGTRATEAARRLTSYAVRDHAVGADEQAEWSDALASVMSTLQTLDHRDREVLLLHAWEGLQGEDLAAALGCSAGAAAVRLHRARHRLRSARASREVPGIISPTEQTGVNP
ncbi:MAG: RNA polymerase sigma factor [Kribbellaceae bacterium]